MKKVEELIQEKEKMEQAEIRDMNVFQVINEIAKQVGWVEKTGNVSYGKTKYDYASEADFLAAIKPLMDRYGLIVYPAKVDVVGVLDGNNTILVTYRFVAVHSTSELNWVDIQTIGQGGSNDDKGMYKAMTGALKYAYRQTFRVGTGDDPEATDSEGNSTNTSKTWADILVAKLKKDGISEADLLARAEMENLPDNPSDSEKRALQAAYKELMGEKDG